MAAAYGCGPVRAGVACLFPATTPQTPRRARLSFRGAPRAPQKESRTLPGIQGPAGGQKKSGAHRANAAREDRVGVCWGWIRVHVWVGVPRHSSDCEGGLGGLIGGGLGLIGGGLATPHHRVSRWNHCKRGPDALSPHVMGRTKLSFIKIKKRKTARRNYLPKTSNNPTGAETAPF